MRIHLGSYDPCHRRSPGEPRSLGIRQLGLRDVNRRFWSGVQSFVPHITDDPENLPRWLILELLHEAPADDNPVLQGIAVLPILFGHAFVDHDDLRCFAVVPVRERPPSFYWNPEYFEEARGNYRPCSPCIGRVRSARRLMAYDLEGQTVIVL